MQRSENDQRSGCASPLVRAAGCAHRFVHVLPWESTSTPSPSTLLTSKHKPGRFLSDELGYTDQAAGSKKPPVPASGGRSAPVRGQQAQPVLERRVLSPQPVAAPLPRGPALSALLGQACGSSRLITHRSSPSRPPTRFPGQPQASPFNLFIFMKPPSRSVPSHAHQSN